MMILRPSKLASRRSRHRTDPALAAARTLPGDRHPRCAPALASVVALAVGWSAAAPGAAAELDTRREADAPKPRVVEAKVPDSELRETTELTRLDAWTATLREPLDPRTLIPACSESGRSDEICGPDASGGDTRSPSRRDPAPDPEPAPAEPSGPTPRAILLVHGFLATGGTSCLGYFTDSAFDSEGLYAELVSKAQQNDATSGGTTLVESVGWYAKDTDCDVWVPYVDDNVTDSDIEVIGEELAALIEQEYTANGIVVDIVAHSLGGLIVRSMLERYGDGLLVERVVTAGTPHGGVSGAYYDFHTYVINAACLLGIDQCLQAAAGSNFITNLEHNPQSMIPTHWTLIGSASDEVVGPNTGTDMDRGSIYRPEVTRYEYPGHYRADTTGCIGVAPVTHGHLIQITTIGYCTGAWPFPTFVSVEKTPSRRILDALGL